MGTHSRKVKRGKRESSKEQSGSAKVEKTATNSKSAGPTNLHSSVSASEFEWHVTLAAKGMAERDNYPMPKSVTTPLAFYEIMAGAALEATGFRSLLERAARAERELDHLRDAIRLADDRAATAGHRVRPAPAGSREAAAAAPPRANPAPTGGASTAPVERRAARVTRRRISGLLSAPRTLVAGAAHDAWNRTKRVLLRRPERVTCAQCGARHPAVYAGDPCLLCDTPLPSRLVTAREVRSQPLAAA